MTVSLGIERMDIAVNVETQSMLNDVVEYAKVNAKKILAAGHCWSFDEALSSERS